MFKHAICALAMIAAFGVQAAPAGTPAAGSHATLPCTQCHQGTTMQAPDKQVCLACHQSYEALAKKTEKMTPNPHFSHRGQPQCSACHSMHAKPRFECNDCHTFAIKMKGE